MSTFSTFHQYQNSFLKVVRFKINIQKKKKKISGLPVYQRKYPEKEIRKRTLFTVTSINQTCKTQNKLSQGYKDLYNRNFGKKKKNALKDETASHAHESK